MKKVTSALTSAKIRKAVVMLKQANKIMLPSFTAMLSPMAMLNSHEDTSERVTKWRKKMWAEFCTELTSTDERFTLCSRKDMQTILYGDSDDDKSVLSDFVMRREGEYADVWIDRLSDKTGFVIMAGDRTSYAKVFARTTKGMVMPTITMADDLENQFSAAVEQAKKNVYFRNMMREKELTRNNDREQRVNKVLMAKKPRRA